MSMLPFSRHARPFGCASSATATALTALRRDCTVVGPARDALRPAGISDCDAGQGECGDDGKCKSARASCLSSYLLWPSLMLGRDTRRDGVVEACVSDRRARRIFEPGVGVQPASAAFRFVPGGTISSIRSRTLAVVDSRPRRAGLELLHRARPDDRRGRSRDGAARMRAPARSATARRPRRAARAPRRRRASAGCSGIEMVVARRHPLRAWLTDSCLAQLARQPPAGERAPRDHAHPVRSHDRQHLRLDAAHEDRVRRLLADEATEAALLPDPLRLDDRRGRVGRRAEVPDLPGTSRSVSAPSVSS